MKKILILVVVLLLAGGGGGAFFLLQGDDDPETVAGSAHEGGQGELSSDEKHIYLKLEPITATIFRNQQAAGAFTAAVTLEIANESARTDIIEVRRRLRDAMFRELHAMFEREEHTGRKVDIDAVKRRMLVVTRRELGEDVVLDVFVNTLMRRGA